MVVYAREGVNGIDNAAYDAESVPSL